MAFKILIVKSVKWPGVLLPEALKMSQIAVDLPASAQQTLTNRTLFLLK